MLKAKSLHLLSLILVLAAMPLAHSIVKLLGVIENQSLWLTINYLIGFSGLALLYYGANKEELKASVFGFLSAHLIFIGFFESTFAIFAKVFNIQPLLSPKTGDVLISPGLQMVELSVFFAIPLFLMMFFDKDVKCNMILWTRRKTKINLPTSQIKSSTKSFALITAKETLFSIWIIYGLSILTLDYRILGMAHPISGILYTLFLASPFYLIYRLLKLKSAGLIFRYSVPVGILFWTWVETLASMKIIKEVYLYPLDYPIFLGINLIAFTFLFLKIKAIRN